MKYASIDIETTGLDPETCQTIEVAMVLDDLKNQRPVETLPCYRTYVIHKVYQGEPTALAMHQKIFERISRKDKAFNYCLAEDVGWKLHDFLNTNGFDTTSKAINVAGKNFGTFDKPFLAKIGVFNCFKIAHRIIDPAILYFDLAKEDERLPDTTTCMRRAGLVKDNEVCLRHEALEDALDVVRLLRKKFAS